MALCKINEKTLEDRNSDHNFVRASVLAMATMTVIMTYSLSRDLYDIQTADKVIVERESPWFGSGRSILGYDRNKDGALDEIIVRGTWYGSKAAAPIRIIYTAKDTEFEALKKIILQETNGFLIK